MSSPDNVIPFPGGRAQTSEDQIRDLAQQLIHESGGPHAAWLALQEMLHAWGQEVPANAVSGRRPPVLLPRRGERACFVVRVDLDNAKPPIWRRLRLASDLSLGRVHEVVQAAMGWTDTHLHRFLMGPGKKDWRVDPFLTEVDVEEGEDGVLEADVRLDEVLSAPGDRLYYEYDFGDSWWHTLKLERVEAWEPAASLARCTDGRRACPLEDVGGISSYQEVLDALRRPEAAVEDEWLAGVLQWLPPDFEPARFSIEEVNEQLEAAPLMPLDDWHPQVADLAGRAGFSGLAKLGVLLEKASEGPADVGPDLVETLVHRYRELLGAVGDGLALTAAGYLPPKVVQTLYHDLDLYSDLVGEPSREHHTFPVLALRESATSLGLLRKSRGKLLLTKVGERLVDDPAGLWEHIRSRVVLGRAHERDAGVLALLAIAAGAEAYEARYEIAEVLADVGWQVSGTTLDRVAYRWALPTLDVLAALIGRNAPAGREAIVAGALLRRTAHA